MFQVPGPWAAVLIPRIPTHPVWLHTWLGAKTTALLPQLHRDHAQCSGGSQTGNSGVSAPVPRPQVELHHYQGQSSHIWTST